MSLINFFAHAGEDHSAVTDTANWWVEVFHQPVWLSLVMVLSALGLIYGLCRLLKFSLAGSLLAVAAAMIAVGILFMPHQPQLTGIILSAGFVLVFVLAFTLLGQGN